MAGTSQSPFSFDINRQQHYCSRLHDFFRQCHPNGCNPTLQMDLDSPSHYLLNVLQLLDFDLEVGTLLLMNPMQLLPLCQLVLQEVLPELCSSGRLYIRCTHLPMTEDTYKKTVSDIRSTDAHHLVTVPGTVVRTGMRKILVVQQTYRCNKCNESFAMERDIEQRDIIPKPTSCKATPNCRSTSFALDTADVKWDYQQIRIQDQITQLAVGSIPRSITCLLEEDLVDTCKAGDDVIVTAIVLRQWSPLAADSRCEVEPVLLANFLKVNNQQREHVDILPETRAKFDAFWQRYQHVPLKGRDLILRNVCPQVFGLYLVKLCVAMTIIGGVMMEKAGTRIRGESHLLLIGDPGTAKSQFLKYASQLSSRSVLTTGIGTTSAGLTVMATKDSGEWVLEAGALVLSDGGICCIDEFSSITEHDRTTIHEAMEQQTLSIAKAGLVTKLSTRCTIIAATNPRGTGKFDLNSSLSINTTLTSPLLSRFDLVLLLVDTQNEEWDRKVSKFILDRAGPKRNSLMSWDVKAEDTGDYVDPVITWDLHMVQQYFALVKTLTPVLTPDAECVLTQYYQLQRLADGRNQARTTIRLLESLVRLAQAHARLMYRCEVQLQDAVMAVIAMEGSSSVARLFQADSALHTFFPSDPDAYYMQQETMILEALGLTAIDPTGNLQFTEMKPEMAQLETEPLDLPKTQATMSSFQSSLPFNRPSLPLSSPQRSPQRRTPTATPVPQQSFAQTPVKCTPKSEVRTPTVDVKPTAMQSQSAPLLPVPTKKPPTTPLDSEDHLEIPEDKCTPAIQQHATSSSSAASTPTCSLLHRFEDTDHRRTVDPPRVTQTLSLHSTGGKEKLNGLSQSRFSLFGTSPTPTQPSDRGSVQSPSKQSCHNTPRVKGTQKRQLGSEDDVLMTLMQTKKGKKRASGTPSIGGLLSVPTSSASHSKDEEDETLSLLTDLEPAWAVKCDPHSDAFDPNFVNPRNTKAGALL